MEPNHPETSPVPQPEAQAPPSAPGRNLSLDVLRGAALLGGLLISVWLFGGFTANKQYGLLSHPSGGNYRLFAAISLLFEGKMRALIGIVFGAGMALYLGKRLQAHAGKAHDYFVRRQLWLMGFGIVNGVLLLWQNDLLFHLGLMGILLLPFAQASPRALLATSLVFMLIFCGKLFWNYSDDKKVLRKYNTVLAVEKKFKADSLARAQKDSLSNKAVAVATNAKDSTARKNEAKKDTLTRLQKEDKEKWEGRLKQMKYDAKADEGHRKMMREVSYVKLWNSTLNSTQGREAAWTYRIGVWELGMSILLGLALLKLGFFENNLSRRQYLLLALAGIGIGLLCGWHRLYFQNAALLDYGKYVKTRWLPYDILVPLERLALAIGYASLAMWLLTVSWLGWLRTSLAACGKISLTLYLLQTIVCVLFFYGIGLNNYGNLSQWQLYLFVLEFWLVQIVFSIFWLKFYPIGPAEWLWRCLVAKKWLPFKNFNEAV
jgi:uncharacterized protein